jgi:hypothetical protein
LSLFRDCYSFDDTGGSYPYDYSEGGYDGTLLRFFGISSYFGDCYSFYPYDYSEGGYDGTLLRFFGISSYFGDCYSFDDTGGSY